MGETLLRIERCLEILVAQEQAAQGRVPPLAPSRDGEDFITRAELESALEEFSGSLDKDIERRFEVQNRSVQSLRAMIARTDELLEQVIESIESAGVHA